MKTDLQSNRVGDDCNAASSWRLADTISTQTFSDIPRLAASFCCTPIAVIGLLDADHKWAVTEIGCDHDQAAAALDLFYQPAHLLKDLFMVGDTLKDKRFSASPFVTCDPSLRFYAGMPLTNPAGNTIGMLCVMDQKPRTLGTKQKDMLRLLARQSATATELSQDMFELKDSILRSEEEVTECRQLQERMLSQVARLMALRAIDVSILSGSSLKQTLDIVLAQVLDLLHIDAAALLLLDPQTHTLNAFTDRGFSQNCPPLPEIQGDCGSRGRAAIEDDRSSHGDRVADMQDTPHSRLMRAQGFVDYYCVPLIARDSFAGVLEIYHRAPLSITPDQMDFLIALAGQAAIAIDNSFLIQGLQQSNSELTQAYDTTIEGWSRALDLRDKETDGHCHRVTETTVRLARMMGLSTEELVHIRRGALLHDIGKMGIPDSILLKLAPLTQEEWEIMRLHPLYAYEMLLPIAFLRKALDIPYYHHEKWDGSGYPHQLEGKQIPLAARIFAVVDVWDALRSDRPYRKGWPTEKVREHLQSLSGTHFDPAVVDAFLTLVYS